MKTHRNQWTVSQTHRNGEKFFPDDPPTGKQVKSRSIFLVWCVLHMECQMGGFYSSVQIYWNLSVLSTIFSHLIPRIQIVWKGICFLSKWYLALWSACAVLGFLHTCRAEIVTAKHCLSSCLAGWPAFPHSWAQMFWFPKPWKGNECHVGT